MVDRRGVRHGARAAAAAALAVGALVAAGAPAQALTTDRWAGDDRYATAATVSANAWPDGAYDVVVVNGTSFADALAAAPLASLYDAPLLTVTADRVPAATTKELVRLRPHRALVVGGRTAVSDAVYGEVGSRTIDGAHRISGDDRYGTAAAVAEQEFAGGADEVYVASGEGFPDALAAGAAGAADLAPLVLTTKGALPPSSLAALEALEPTRITVVGGEAVISPAVQAQLEAAWPGTVRRISGGDRYATAAKVARDVSPTSPGTLLASGLNFPDALAGAALGVPLLLTRPDCLPQVTADAIGAMGVEEVVGLGGTAVLSEDALRGRVCALPAAVPAPAPSSSPAPSPSGGSLYANCDAVRAAGKAPIRRGDPGFEDKFDRDGDGVGCETV
ncbi:cell wall-binding repeat-containing protein [Quadrisphaera sp. KR29]|uniref:cell wall-binding repeat-containing protein n=1 Tax=Quadrisphaera sp. KR29 TaxID=3461391 RepID=UPI004044C19F